MSTGLFQDLKYAFRRTARSPGVTAAIIISIGLGIAANTTVFSITNTAFLGTLPVEQPERLVSFAEGSICYADYVDYRDQTDVFEGISARFPGVPASLGGPEPERIWGQLVTANYFEVLRLGLARGRGFLPAEEKVPGRDAVIVLSESLWRRRFGSDPDILGRAVIVNDHPYTVVGIAPPGFHGEDRVLSAEFWVPISMVREMMPDLARQEPLVRRNSQWIAVTGRLKHGIKREQAQAAVNVVKDRIDAEYRKDKAGKDPMLLVAAGGLPGSARGPVSAFLMVMMIVAGLVLLIACANVANVLLARAAARQKEIGIRLATGASRARLIRQLLAESVLLASLGAGVGVFLAYAATRALSHARLPLPLPISFELAIDARVLWFTAVLGVLTGVTFGMAPALRATSPDLVATLKGETGGFGCFRRFELRNFLVVLQVALSIMLLVSTGLFLRSLQNASSIDLGMRTDNVLLMTFDPKLHDYSTDRSRQFLRQLRESLTAHPGVESASFMDIVPLSLGGQGSDYTAAGIGDRGLQKVSADFFRVGTDYFRTMGVALRRGRDFDSGDVGRDVVILNQAMAGRLFGVEEPLGRTILKDGKTYEIVGIAANSKSRTHGEGRRACVYHFLERDPNAGYALFGITLAVRTRGSPRALIRPAREKIRTLDPNLAVFNIETMQEHVNKALLVPRVSAMLFGVFGSVGLTLAAIGLYGVISYSLRRRTKEIGIRMALGASASQVLWAVVGQGMLLTAVGLVIGLAAAAALGRLFTAFLYGISATDPFTFVAVPAALLGITLLTTLLPAWRAVRVAPIDALRYE